MKKSWKQKLYLRWVQDQFYVKVVKYRWTPQLPRDTRHLGFQVYTRNQHKKNLNRTRKAQITTQEHISCVWLGYKAPFRVGLFMKYVDQYRENFPDEFLQKVKHFEWESQEVRSEIIKEFVNLHIKSTEMPFHNSEFAVVKEYDIIPS